MQHDGGAQLVLDVINLRVQMALRGHRSMAALARAAGIAPGYLRVISQGLLPPEHTRQKVAGALGVATSDLWKPVTVGSTERAVG